RADGGQDEVLRSAGPPVPHRQGRTGQDVTLAQAGLPAFQVSVPCEAGSVQADDEPVGLVRPVRIRNVQAVGEHALREAKFAARQGAHWFDPVGAAYGEDGRNGRRSRILTTQYVGEELVRALGVGSVPVL